MSSNVDPTMASRPGPAVRWPTSSEISADLRRGAEANRAAYLRRIDPNTTGDLVVTVPATFWDEWLREGDLAPDELNPTPRALNQTYAYGLGHNRPRSQPGDRVYVVAHGKLRGYAPLIDVDEDQYGRISLIRGGGAVAVTIPGLRIPGFRGYRYRWWALEEEAPFPTWRIP